MSYMNTLINPIVCCRRLVCALSIGTVLVSAGLGLTTVSSSVFAGDETVASTEENALVKVNPQMLLQNMVQAMGSLNYIGEFIHVTDSKLEAMRIVHSASSEGEFERLTSLNGEAREIFRNDEQLICIWPGSNSLIVSSAKDRETIPRIDAEILQSEFYQSVHEGFDRVAGRDVHVISMSPVDKFRYGHRFWIDTESNMLLRMTLLDESGAALDQFMFTSIEYPDAIDSSIFDAGDAENAFELPDDKPVQSPADALPLDGPAVSFNSLPGGYHKVAETYDPMPISDTPISHVTITDGMASVSVYVEYSAKLELYESSFGMSSMGAVNAYTRLEGNTLVTVVGEVPAAVIENISMAVELKNE